MCSRIKHKAWPQNMKIPNSSNNTTKSSGLPLIHHCSPCEGYKCMEFANCVDISTEEDPQVECICQLGRIKDASGTLFSAVVSFTSDP